LIIKGLHLADFHSDCLSLFPQKVCLLRVLRGEGAASTLEWLAGSRRCAGYRLAGHRIMNTVPCLPLIIT